MPLLPKSNYRPPVWLRGGHLQTIYPALFRKAPRLEPTRERLELADGDFLDLDWYLGKNQPIAILAHGLEGSSQAGYILGMASSLLRSGWSVLAWNNRGCSGEINRLHTFYHAGKTDDLSAVIHHVAEKLPEKNIHLIGFSLGGNILLKHLGEAASYLHPNVKSAVAISVPCDLASSARALSSASNSLYNQRFLNTLRKKIRTKHHHFPEKISLNPLHRTRSLREFDNHYTAPLHGFKNAADYWEQSSSLGFLEKIQIPTLLVNAANDPFLGSECFPREIAKRSKHLFLETPAQGGHVGFADSYGQYWSETRTLQFLQTR